MKEKKIKTDKTKRYCLNKYDGFSHPKENIIYMHDNPYRISQSEFC